MNDLTIGRELIMTNNLMNRKIFTIISINNKDISPIQCEILKYFINNNNQKVKQRDLEHIFNLRRSTICGILKTMLKNGFIIHSNINGNQKSKEVCLTDETYHKFLTMQEKIKSMERRITNNINSHDIDIFMRVLKQIQKNILEEGDKKDV